MDVDPIEWLHLLVRWVHVFAGILWIGSTYYFTWLDHRLEDEEREKGQPGADGRVWMVHSGGFYAVEKLRAPDPMPKRLHWFKWEAATTWLSGVALLVVVYYLGGTMLDPSVSSLSLPAAVGISVATLAAAWVVYDVLWISPVGDRELVGAAVCYALLVGLAYGLTRVLSARAAFMQVGAVIGTIMAANVWLRILPAQTRLIAATKEGRPPDVAIAARAKARSRHNTFMVVPVVLIMIGNHFPTATYGSDYNWAVLAVLVLVGWGAAYLLRR